MNWSADARSVEKLGTQLTTLDLCSFVPRKTCLEPALFAKPCSLLFTHRLRDGKNHIYFGMFPEVLISLFKVAIYGRYCLFGSMIVAIVYDRPCNPTENGFNYVEVLVRNRQRSQFN
jgi:hypothetical protein